MHCLITKKETMTENLVHSMLTAAHAVLLYWVIEATGIISYVCHCGIVSLCTYRLLYSRMVKSYFVNHEGNKFCINWNKCQYCIKKMTRVFCTAEQTLLIQELQSSSKSSTLVFIIYVITIVATKSIVKPFVGLNSNDTSVQQTKVTFLIIKQCRKI
jgi:hypothetical protein